MKNLSYDTRYRGGSPKAFHSYLPVMVMGYDEDEHAHRYLARIGDVYDYRKPEKRYTEKFVNGIISPPKPPTMCGMKYTRPHGPEPHTLKEYNFSYRIEERFHSVRLLIRWSSNIYFHRKPNKTMSKKLTKHVITTSGMA